MNPFKIAEHSYRTRMHGVDPQGGMNLMSDAEIERRQEEDLAQRRADFVDQVKLAAQAHGLPASEELDEDGLSIYIAGDSDDGMHEGAGVYVWESGNGHPNRLEDADFDGILQRLAQLPANLETLPPNPGDMGDTPSDECRFWRVLVGEQP